MKAQTIHLGFEVGTGTPVAIPLAHLCVTGQTQLSGKTTTLEALISRSQLKAIAFVTKRGEGAFTEYARQGSRVALGEAVHFLKPFFRHKADWQFVSEILGAVLNEKLKFERSWIMKVARGARSLHDVERNVNDWLAKPKLRSLDESVLTTISEYFKLFMPELESLPFTESLELEPGLNVMDLSSYSTPLQMLVISAVVEEVYKHQKGVVTLIPEAWEFVPQGKNSPAKAACVALIRKGGGLKNFVWVDSQDLAGVEKVIVKSAGVYLLGVQREQNEVKRTLEHVPRSFRLKPDDIMTLSKGQFWACFGDQARKVYVQPAFMRDEWAIQIAKGEIDVDTHSVVRVSRVNSQTGAHSALPEPSSLTIEHLNERFNDIMGGLPVPASNLLSVGDHIAIIGDPPRREDYQTMPAGLDYRVDDGSQPYDHDRITNIIAAAMLDNRPQSVIDGEREEIERMDQREREGYETTIRQLREQLEQVKALLPANSANLEPLDEVPQQGPGTSGLEVHKARELASAMVADDWSLSLLARKIAALLPGGIVKVEAREVVLKEFQTAQVARTLEAVSGFTKWQKDVIRYMESRGARATKKDIFVAILGKEPQGGTGQTDRYKAIDDLCGAGWLRLEKGFVYANLAANVKAQLAPYTPTEQDIDAVIGQVLLKLK